MHFDLHSVCRRDEKPPEPLVTVQYISRGSATDKAVADARARVMPELVAAARRKAQELALAANLTSAGSVEFVSDPALGGLNYFTWGRFYDPAFFDSLSEARFLGNGTQATFSVSLRSRKQ